MVNPRKLVELFLVLYFKGMRIMMFQLPGFYCIRAVGSLALKDVRGLATKLAL